MRNLADPDVYAHTRDLLERLCAVSSPSGDREGLGRAAAVLAEALSARGLRTEIRDEPDARGRPLPVLYARSPGLGDRHLFLVGHLDTVLPAATPAFRDGRLWATGAADMKGGLAALVGALDQLHHDGREPPGDLLLVAVPDEEVIGDITRRVVAEHGRAARVLWVLEPGLSREAAEGTGGTTAETLVIGRRGMLQWQLDVVGRSAHAGTFFWQGRSALVAAADFCVSAHGLSRPGRGPTVNAGRMVAGERGFVEQLEENADLLFSPRQTNVVPDRARVEGEARFLHPGDGPYLRESLYGLAEDLAGSHEGVRAELTISTYVHPLAPGTPSRDQAETARRLAAARGWSLEAEEDRRGISFSNFLPEASQIPVLDGLGPAGGGLHTREEFVHLESLDRRIVLLADLLHAFRQ